MDDLPCVNGIMSTTDLAPFKTHLSNSCQAHAGCLSPLLTLFLNGEINDQA